MDKNFVQKLINLPLYKLWQDPNDFALKKANCEKKITIFVLQINLFLNNSMNIY